MIPHHENAVNMAKLALKMGDPPKGEVEDLMYEIINGQNAQITFMRNWLAEHGHGTSTEVQCGDYKSPDKAPTTGGAPQTAWNAPYGNYNFRNAYAPRPRNNGFPTYFWGR